MPRLAPLALLAVLTALGGCGSGGPAPPRSSAELVNFRLGPELSHWLVGPIARMATVEEAEAFLGLENEFAAIDLIEAFWRRRDPDPADRENPVRLAFERRAKEADRLYSEGGILGRRTPRGTIYVLYGEPEEVEFEIAPQGGAPIEVWIYPAGTPPGLNGRPPERRYFWRKQGDFTVPYRPGGRRARIPGG